MKFEKSVSTTQVPAQMKHGFAVHRPNPDSFGSLVRSAQNQHKICGAGRLIQLEGERN